MFKKIIKFSIFSKLLLFFILVIIFLIVAFIFSSQFYLKYFKDRIEERTILNLNMLGDKIDSALMESFNKASDYIWSGDLDVIRKSLNPVRDFKNGFPMLGVLVNSFLHSVYYIDNKDGIVIGKHNIEKTESFFKIHYPYLKQKDLIILPNNIFNILPVITIFKVNELTQTSVMPFLMEDSKKKNNYFLMNISEEKIFQLLKTFTVNSNAHLFIMDSDGNIRSYTNRQKMYIPEIYKSISDKTFIEKVKSGKSFYSNYFGEKRLIIQCQSKRSTVQKLYYVSAIPLSELYKQSLPLTIITIIISILSFCFSIILSFLMSKSIYNPIKKIADLLNYENREAEKGNNELAFISSEISNLFKDKKKLTEDLTKTLPIFVENYLYRILNEEEEIIEENFNDILKQNDILFKYNNFIVSVVLINFNNEFYEKFNRQDEMEILKSTYKLFKNGFNKDYGVNLLNIAKNEICIIINLNNENETEIFASINKIHDVYKSSKNYLELFAGIGKTGTGITGLKKSYNEALRAVSSISPFGTERIKVFNEMNSNDLTYQYNINEENQLLNFLAGGYEKESKELFNKIITQNKDISMSKQKDLYLQLYYTGIRTLNRLMINPKELLKENYIDISHEYKKMSVEAIYLYLIKFYEKIIDYSKRDVNCKIKIESVVDYINKNFNNDICLELLSDQFKVSQSHLSRLLKDYLNMPFQQYLNNLRIKKAKYLLKDTDKLIEEISKDCGFNSRFTFIKMFKKLEGITPTDYRNINNF